MPLRCFVAALLFYAFTTLAAAQGTPGGKTPVLTGFTPLSEEELKVGVIRLFDGISTFGWKGDAKVEKGSVRYPNTFQLSFTGKFEDTPCWFFDEIGELEKAYTAGRLADGHVEIVVQPGKKRETTSLFDGKTLVDWTLHGKAEAVVEDGAIRLTNGQGSLESDGKYGDFVLQLEYFTPVRPEGKGVNSGVFFRCIPGEVMNGYECQILNKPGENDYKNFIGTDTGGIFRRQVGRNVGPKDGEWNYLTLAARGARMAAWVNGIQVTDWTDERAPHNNPRNGCRTEAGTIQFQGHDPETEILFRNIRIQELRFKVSPP